MLVREYNLEISGG